MEFGTGKVYKSTAERAEEASQHQYGDVPWQAEPPKEEVKVVEKSEPKPVEEKKEAPVAVTAPVTEKEEFESEFGAQKWKKKSKFVRQKVTYVPKKKSPEDAASTTTTTSVP